MTVSAGRLPVRYDGDDAAINFSYPYKFYDADELVVIHRDTSGNETYPLLNTDYTVNGGGGAVGSIDFPKVGSTYSTLASGSPAEILTIDSEHTEERTVDLSGSYQFAPQNTEGDKQAIMLQEHRIILNSSVRKPPSDPDSVTMELPNNVTRAGKYLYFDALGNATVDLGTGQDDTARQGSFIYPINGGGAAIVAGEQEMRIAFGFAGTIDKVELLADQSGSIVLDIWKDTYANYPPTVADTITASAKPTLSTAIKSQDATLTGWTKTFSNGENWIVKVDSASTVTHVDMIIYYTKTGV
jgi:hypothetical protein